MANLDIASKKLSSFFYGCMHLFTGTPPPLLYHYTTESGLCGILRSGRFWSSNTRHHNDAAELRYAASIFRAHLERAHAQDYLDEACELFAAMRPYLEITGASKVHTISLVTESDNDHLWRLYGDRGAGCSLAFPTGSVANWGENWYLLRCSYSEDELNNFCRYSISQIRSIYLDDRAVDPTASAADYAALFFQFAVWFAPMFKAKVWSDEQEWRLVRIVEDDDRLQRPDGKYYVEGPSSKTGRLEIGGISLGPNNQSPEAIQRVRSVLAEAGYGATTVYLSSRPRILSISRRSS